MNDATPDNELHPGSDMNSLSALVNKATLEGYAEQFTVTAQGLHSETAGKNYPPDEVRISNFYRFEGASDPADNAILYTIETADGRKGTLIDAYGTYADSKVNEFIRSVEDIQKKAGS